ncbi:hypothetical protein JW977_03985 [Candidatus Falkowbacteria bacterium]|nr:hypothetical protein [Candidatus Falkowbacteria bacterium]
MKPSLTIKICLIIAILLTGGVLIASAAGYGFISYENKDTVVFWDNVKIIGKGLTIKGSTVSQGSANVTGDIYLKRFIGFGCSANYLANQDCNTLLGDGGGNGVFLKATKITSALTITGATKTSITASVLDVNKLNISKSLFVGIEAPEGNIPIGSVFASGLKTNTMTVSYMPGIVFEREAIFEPTGLLKLKFTH